MTVISEIEVAVAQLSREELSVFRDWFQEFDAVAWDKQFEDDVTAGRLDAFAEEALRDLREGRCEASLQHLDGACGIHELRGTGHSVFHKLYTGYYLPRTADKIKS